MEFLRATGSAAHTTVRSLIEAEEQIATTEIIVMELLAGARDDEHLGQLRQLVFGCDVLSIQGLVDYEMAAAIFRNCRKNGETIRSMTDCVIAAIAVRTGADLLHADRDYAAIARHFPLLTVVMPQD